MKAKKITALLLSLALMVSIVGCTSNNNDDEQSKNTDTPSSEVSEPNGDDTPKNTHINVAESFGFDLFHTIITPSNTAAGYGFTYYLSNAYDTLVTYNEQGELVGSLAETWDMSDDGTVYTFNLRKGVNFSDGSDFTSDDVVGSLKGAPVNLGQYNGSYGMLSTIIKDVVAVDETTVELHLTQPYYSTLRDLCLYNPFGIVSSEQLNEDLTIKDSFKTGSYGTGPYMYEGDTDGQTYNFVANPNYWGEAPDVESFSVKVIPDNNAMLLALKNNEIDLIYGVPKISAEAYQEIEATDGFTALTDKNTLQTYYMGYNMANEFFGDQVVREAITTAIDKTVITDTIYGGIRGTADTFFAKTLPYCDVEQTVYEYSLEEANKLLDDAGYTDTDGDGIREVDGKNIEGNYLYQTASASEDDLVLYICDQLEQIGISLTPQSAPMMDWYAMITSGEYAVTNFQTQGGYYDPTSVITNMNPNTSMDPLMMQMSQFLPNGSELIIEVNKTADEDRIAEIYETVIKTMSDNCFNTPLYYAKQVTLYDEDVASYSFEQDSNYLSVQNVKLK